jgi:hypothetical protein
VRPRDSMRVVPVNVAIAPAASIERERLVAEQERAAGDRGDHRDLVALCERTVRCRVLLVHGVEQAARLLAEPERRPDVRDGRRVDLALGPAGTFTQAGKETHANRHGAPALQRNCQSWYP